MQPARILIVEDSPSLALTYRDFLLGRYETVMAGSAAEADALLRTSSYDSILLDLRLPDEDGLSYLQRIRARGVETPVIVITADARPETAVQAVQRGAQDFISKPVGRERLTVTLRNILEKNQLQQQLAAYRARERDGFCDFIGNSPAMTEVYRMIESAARSQAPVMITGESGTGKELAARAIHRLGPRAKKPFEALNCAAVPGALLESEIFGHAKGAFTGAVAAYAGAAERAHQGTFFLDELTEMPMEMQSKLLRFTQSGVFRPVGASQECLADVRFVSATNRDPAGAVRSELLREDLYYRLNVITIQLPPLRLRGDDVLLIARHLLARISAEEGKVFHDISTEAADRIQSYDWPGNVRQLQNVLRRAVVLNEGDILKSEMLALGDALQERPAGGAAMAGSSGDGIVPLREMERQAIENALRLCGGNISEAARRLKVNASTLHRKLGRWRGKA